MCWKSTFPIRLMTIVAFMIMLSSCAVTTNFTEGTSETLENTSDASTDFTSSTSPDDEEEKSGVVKARAFASANLDRLKEDMSRGKGEHLSAFAHLLGISEAHETEFFAFAKKKYPVLFSSEPTTSEEMLARLDSELNDHPTWRQ